VTTQLTRWLTKRVEFPIGGRKWPLVFTYRALLEAEESTGVDMLTANLTYPSAAITRGLIHAALHCAGAGYSIQDVGKAVQHLGTEQSQALLISAWVASMADPRDRDRDIEPDPAEDEIEKRVKANAQTYTPPPEWADIWASARSADLGLTDDEWLDMTPRQFYKLQQLYLARMRREELMTGILAATIENFSMCAPKKPVKPEMFMLHPFPPPPPVPIADQIMNEMAKMKRFERNKVH
jgi:hypothetical protein